MNKDLQDAIDYSKKKAEELTVKSNELYEENYEESSNCQECANKYEQFAALFTELQERREADRWIPVSERLPEKAGEYLCTLHYAIPPYHMFHPEKDIYVDDIRVNNFDGTAFVSSVTHWRPLPKAPKSEA